MAALVAALGVASGYSIAAFTTMGMWHPGSSTVTPTKMERALPRADQDEPASAPLASTTPVEHYVCKGCGPTLAEREIGAMSMTADYQEPTNLRSMQPHEPVPFDETSQAGGTTDAAAANPIGQ
jgi:hypothetical protein